MIRFTIVDMFAQQPFAGSALGVVPEAEDLSTECMQRVATALRTDETVFVLPPTASEATHRVRVFTPAGESPYGSHSGIGTAATLVRNRFVPPGEVVQECGPKLQRITAERTRATMSASGPLPGSALDPESLLDAAGLSSADVADAAPATAGFGPLFHYLPVQDGAVGRAEPDFAAMTRLGLDDVFVFSWDPDLRTAHGRLFAPGYGIPEDPACSAVALGLGGWLLDAGWLPAEAGRHEYRIDQGAELGRAARLDCALTIAPTGEVTGSVTGRVIPTVAGKLVRTT